MPKVLHHEWRRVEKAVKKADAADESHRPELLHKVRKKAKRVRYAAETLEPVLGREARARSIFALQRFEARYERAGLYVDSHLPPNALVVTSWESGSIRYYGHRNTLVWDALDPAWLDRAASRSSSNSGVLTLKSVNVTRFSTRRLRPATSRICLAVSPENRKTGWAPTRVVSE